MPDLTEYRTAFIAQVSRYVSQASEQQRLTQVLDAFIDWSLQRPAQLAHHDSDYDQQVVSFARRSDGAVFWSAYPRRDDGAKFEILPRMSKSLDGELIDEARALIRSVSKEPIRDHGTLRLPFIALKSATTRARVTDLLERLLP